MQGCGVRTACVLCPFAPLAIEVLMTLSGLQHFSHVQVLGCASGSLSVSTWILA